MSFDPDIIATRSHAERLLRRICRRFRLPAYEPNVQVCGFEVDAYWEDERQAVEIDGRAYHSDAIAFERDHRRDAVLKRNRVDVLRLSYRMLVDDPAGVAETIRCQLADRRRLLQIDSENARLPDRNAVNRGGVGR